MRYFYLFGWLLLADLAGYAQASFSAVWPFDGSTSGSTNQSNVSTGGASLVGVGLNNVANYVAGQNGQAANVANWSQSAACNFSEYVQISVSPLNGQKITLTQLSVFVNRSNSGPQELRIRSSVTNYGADLTVSSVGTGFQQISVGLSGSGYTDQTGTITFRLYGCNGTGGTLRLDDLTINGTVTTTPLPVSLLSFTAKADGNRVQLAWTTTWERDADRFVVDHSTDLTEFGTVGEVLARGTTDFRQDYGLTDPNPRPGPNYYRLRQIDRDGTAHSFRPVSVIIRTDEPAISVYPNPAEPGRIHLRLWNVGEATVRLLTSAGQVVNGRLERQADEANWIPAYPLPMGLYWLEITTNAQRRRLAVLVR